jgi:hypothetical protein
MLARQLCLKVNLKIRLVDFIANIIVFGLIDCAKKSVKMTTPEGKELEFVTEPIVTAKGVANRAKVNQLDASQGTYFAP